MRACLLIATLVSGLVPAPSAPTILNRLLDEFEARLVQEPASLRVDTTLRELFPELTHGALKAVP